MNKRKINIIWADDENIPQLSEDYIKHELEEEGLNLLGRARDAKNLSILIEQNKWRVDAVITDANMPYDIEEQNEDVANRDLSGLNEVLSIKRQHNTILFYIYSGRADLLEERYTSELNDFKQNGRIFYKLDPNADIKMFDKIRKDVEAHSTPEFQIRFNFSEEFEAAKAIGADADRKLMEALMREYNNEKCIPDKHLFVDARVIMEAIFKACSKIKTSPNKVMLPEGRSLKNYVRLLTLGKDQDEIFVMNENGRKLLPFPLTEELKCFNEITQDSAHPLKMNEYLNKLKGSHALSHIHLHHITWYILMDFLLWFKRSKDIYANSNTELWSYNVVDEVIITEITERYYLAKPYLLQRGVEHLNIGDKVGVIKSTFNNNSKYKDSYPKFVVSNFYFVISNSNGE